jgi:ubiquinone/menaquinone biosynthesis C-methylase UbiE
MAVNENKGYKGKGMEGFFAAFYDKNAKKYIMEQYRIWTKMLLEIVPKNANLLEIAPGPGYLAIELAKAGVKNIAGLDISETFVQIAIKNAKEAGVRINFSQGNASHMPFEKKTFSHIICTSAFKNFSEPLNALNEMYRVLIPKGTIWLCDMRQDVSNSAIDKYVAEIMKQKGLNALFTRLTFKYMLRKRAYTEKSLREIINQTKFQVKSFSQNTMEFYFLLKK